MVSWSRAFKGAAGIIGFSIIWWFIGGILIAAGMIISGMGFSMSSFSPGASFLGWFLGVILVFIGIVVGALGTLAAQLKILSEIVAEEVQGK